MEKFRQQMRTYRNYSSQRRLRPFQIQLLETTLEFYILSIFDSLFVLFFELVELKL